MKNRHYGNLLDSISERFDTAPAGPPPDIKALRAAMKAGNIAKNAFPESAEKPNRHSGAASFIDSPRTESGKILYDKNSGYDYRKSSPQIFGRNNEGMSESEIIARLNRLLEENESEGLDSDKANEVKQLYRKLR